MRRRIGSQGATDQVPPLGKGRLESSGALETSGAPAPRGRVFRRREEIAGFPRELER
jgi:hypothetical protein